MQSSQCLEKKRAVPFLEPVATSGMVVGVVPRGPPLRVAQASNRSAVPDTERLETAPMPSFSKRAWTLIALVLSAVPFAGSADARVLTQVADVVYVSPVETVWTVPTSYSTVVRSSELVPTAAYIYPTTTSYVRTSELVPTAAYIYPTATSYVETDYVVRTRPWWRRARYVSMPVATAYAPTIYAPTSWRVIDSALTTTSFATTPCGEASRVTYGGPQNAPADDSTTTSKKRNTSAGNSSTNPGAGESGPDNQVIRSQAKGDGTPPLPRDAKQDGDGQINPNTPAAPKPGDFPLETGDPKNSTSEKPVASPWGIVAGRVLSSTDNKPIEKVEVTAQPYSSIFEPRTFTTDALGRFSFHLSPGSWVIKIPSTKAGESISRKIVVSDGRVYTAEGDNLPRAGLELSR